MPFEPPEISFSLHGHEDPLSAWGRCAIESHAFSAQHKWGLIRVTGLNFPGREHWGSLKVVNEESLECQVRDGTLRQFSPTAVKLFLGDLDDWLDNCVELMGDDVRYEMFTTLGDPEPFYWDHWIREDLTPGSQPYRPWADKQ